MFDNPWILGSPTFGGNPLACAAFISTIKYMLENDIPGQMKDKGDYYMKGLKKLQEKYPTVLTDLSEVLDCSSVWNSQKQKSDTK